MIHATLYINNTHAKDKHIKAHFSYYHRYTHIYILSHFCEIYNKSNSYLRIYMSYQYSWLMAFIGCTIDSVAPANKSCIHTSTGAIIYQWCIIGNITMHSAEISVTLLLLLCCSSLHFKPRPMLNICQKNSCYRL